MKKLLLTLAFGSTLVGMALQVNAKIWRLNNSNNHTINPAIDADFTGTLQQAHDSSAVLDGDTIHIEQSNTSYGAITMTKRLVLLGPGYFLNQNPNTQVNKDYGATIGSVTMAASTCSGSVITGLTISGSVTMATNNLTLMRNYINFGNYDVISIGSGSASDIDSINIKANYIYAGYFKSSITNNTGTTGLVTNVNIANNILDVNNPYDYILIYFGGNFSGIIRNNTFWTSNPCMNVSNMYVVNNMSSWPNTSNLNANTFYNCVVEYNMGMIASQYVSPSGTNNTLSNNLTNTSQGLQGSGTSDDGYFQLLATSPAKGAGKNGNDLGVFGGQIPYVLSGLPTVPNIYSVTIDPIAPGATSIHVNVSAKSN